MEIVQGTFIFGDGKDLQFNPVKYTIPFPNGVYLLSDVEVDPTINPVITYDDNVIERLDNKNYTVYGDIRNLVMSVMGENNTSPLNPETKVVQISNYEINFGDDTLTFGNGNNVLHGDLQDFMLSVHGGISTQGSPTWAAVYNNTFNFGEDIITAGDGNNVIYGDLRDATLEAKFGHAQDAALLSDNPADTSPSTIVAAGDGNTFNFAIDTITLGDGVNVVFGDLRDLSLIAIAPVPHVGGFFATTVSDLNPLRVNFAGDHIDVGDGDNTIYGNFRSIYALGDGNAAFGEDGILTVSNNGNVGLVIAAEGNIIDMGDGNNSSYGDGRDFTLHLLSGRAIGGDGTFGVSANNNVSFGDDEITAGAGKNVVHGDVADFTLHAEGEFAISAALAAGAQFQTSTFTFGDDEITLGDGVILSMGMLSFLA